MSLDPLAEQYLDPISERYASPAMRALLSPLRRTLTWRELWIALAEAEHEMGLPVTAAQIEELHRSRDRVDLDRVAELEKKLRHDVMAHIHAYGEVAPKARPILHLGATSCFITDNADLILIRRALGIVDARLLRMIHALARFARAEADRPTLGLTHLQPAQLTTVGKRAALWMQDLVEVRGSLESFRGRLPFRGVKGATGTQASFLQLFGGDGAKVQELEARVAAKMGFEHCFALTGQTYPRIWDYRLQALLTELAIAAHKFSTDLRLLQSWGEVEEPYEKTQVGSTAMPYKRNPIRAERIGALAKHLMSLASGVAAMAATQWFERTLDDSALRRVTIPQAFLTTDALLVAGRNVAEGLTVNDDVIERRVVEHLPFLAAEEILMQGVVQGGDRQQLHERLRRLGWAAKEAVQKRAEPNPLRQLIEKDPTLGPILASLPPWEPRRFVGLAPQQTRAYIEDVVSLLPIPEEDDLRELSV